MTIVKDGYPAIFGALVVALITYFVFGPIWAVIPGVLALFFLWFFRNPTSMPTIATLSLCEFRKPTRWRYSPRPAYSPMPCK